MRNACACALVVALGCLGCRGDEGPTSNPSELPEPMEPASLEVIASASQAVDPAAGASIELAGARLEVPAGSLAEGSTLGLLQVALPLDGFERGDLPLAGQIPLSDFGFALTVDPPVELDGPIFVELPIAASRLPDDGSVGELGVAAFDGAQLLVQHPPESAGDDRVRIRFDAPSLAPAVGAPRAAGLAFTTVLASLATVNYGTILASSFHPLIAVGDDLRFQRYPGRYQTENFAIYHRGDLEEVDAVAVGQALEDAHALVYERLGFTLPNVRPFSRRYRVYMDDLSEHYWVLGTPDGVTFPGNILLGGASYLNTQRNSRGGFVTGPPVWPSTAAHEYVHSLQWGSTMQLTPISLGKAFDPEGSWLFEGVATALAGRIIAGEGPTRNLYTERFHPEQGHSIYTPGVHSPAEDVAQDFFLFLEKEIGGRPYFYLDIFEALPDARESDVVEPSVWAVDQVLRQRAGGADGMSRAYRDWVRDFIFDDPTFYGFPPEPKVSARIDGREESSFSLPPLSYRVHEYTTLSTELTLEVRIPSDNHLQIQLLAQVPGQPVVEAVVTDPEEPALLELTDLPEGATVRVAFANPYLGVDDAVEIDLAVSDGVESLQDVLKRICPPQLVTSTGTYSRRPVGRVGPSLGCIQCQTGQCAYDAPAPMGSSNTMWINVTRRPSQWREESCHPMGAFHPFTYRVAYGEAQYLSVAVSSSLSDLVPPHSEQQALAESFLAQIAEEGVAPCTGGLAFRTDSDIFTPSMPEWTGRPRRISEGETASLRFSTFGDPTFPLTLSWPGDECGGGLDCSARTREVPLEETVLVDSEPRGELRQFFIPDLMRCNTYAPFMEGETGGVRVEVTDADGRFLGLALGALRCEEGPGT